MAKEMEWEVRGDCTEACTSPPVCPYYWGSSTPKDLHDGKIYVGKSTENKLDEPDLPRGKWNRPNMSNTYYRFSLNPDKLQWTP